MVFMGEKGFIITIDSFVAVTLMLFIIVAAFSYMSGLSLVSWNSVFFVPLLLMNWLFLKRILF